MSRTSVAGQNVVINKPKTAKKKNPRNAFSFYLDDAMIELRKSGRYVASKAEAVPLVSDNWKSMTPAQKAPYEEKAKAWKAAKKQDTRSGRLDNTGELIDNRIDMDEKAEQQRRAARKIFKTHWPAGKGVCDVHFYIISFQSLFELPDEEGYQPCEVACVRYSLNRGIIAVYHEFIDPGRIKLGMRGEIRIFSEKTHRIPEQGFERACSRYDMIWDELLHFIKPDRNSSTFPPLFCKGAEMRKTSYCLEWLSANAGMSNRLGKLFEIEEMIAELYSHGGMMRPSRSSIETGCDSHMYDYAAGTVCDYHDEIECIYCSVLVVKKCCYWMSDSLAKVYGYEITDKHLPVRKTPSYIISTPDMVSFNERPMRQRNQQAPRYNEELVSEGSTSSSSNAFGSRDIRYRPNFDVVPSRTNCTTVTSDTLASTSSHMRSPDRPPSDASGPSYAAPHLMASNRPGAKGPTVNPAYMPKSGVKLAPNFQTKPKQMYSAPRTGAFSDRCHGDDIDELSQDFSEASSICSGVSESDLNSAPRIPNQMLGVGRGRGRGRF